MLAPISRAAALELSLGVGIVERSGDGLEIGDLLATRHGRGVASHHHRLEGVLAAGGERGQAGRRQNEEGEAGEPGHGTSLEWANSSPIDLTGSKRRAKLFGPARPCGDERERD